MGVYVRQDSPFYQLLLEGDGARPTKKEPTKILIDALDAEGRKRQRRLAQHAYIARMNELAKVRYDLPVERRTIGFTAHAAWFERHHLGQRKGAAREREILKQFIAYFQDRDLSTFTRQTVQEYISERLTHTIGHTTRTISPSTVNREIDVLKAVLREAVPRHLPVNPLLGLKRLKGPRPKKGRIITPAEERRLLAHLAPSDRALYLVAVDTLMRLSNVLNLRWADVKRGHIELHDSKTGPYTPPLSRRAAEALAALPRVGPYCFPDRRTAKTPRDQRGTIRRVLQRACRLAKIPYGRAIGGITWHTATRATGATRMLRDKIDLRTVQQIGNWKDIRSAQTYFEPDRRGARRAVNRIGRQT